MTGRRIVKLAIATAVFVLVGAGVYLRSTRGEEPCLADLPEGVLASGRDIKVTEVDLEAFLNSLPQRTREVWSKDPEGSLEKLVEKRLLLAEARKLPEEALPNISGKSKVRREAILINALKVYVTKGVEASADEVFKKYKAGLLARAELRKNREWVRQVRAQLTDPLAKAKASGKVVIADFGRGICPSCKQIEAVLEELQEEVGDRYEIVLVNIDKFPAAAREYGIKSIPQQVYFNTEGEEVYRPDPGSCSRERVLEILQTVEKKGTYEGEATFTFKVKRMVAGGSWLAMILVFVMGFLTASNPCVLATIPLLIGFIGGYKEASGLKKSFLFSLFFVLGLSVTFMILGIIAGLTGSLLGQVGDFWTYLVVGVCVVMGLHLLGVVQLGIPVPQGIKPGQRGIISSFSFGMLFGIISTPCAVPIVAVLMVLIATEGSVIYAALMLLVYSLGHSSLLLVAGTSMGAAKRIIESKGLTAATNALRKVAAVLIIAVGLYFLYR